MSLTSKEIEYFESQLPEGSKVVENLEDLMQNHYMIVLLLESLNHYPEIIKHRGTRMYFCKELAIEFSEIHKNTNWGETLLWDEELEIFIKRKLKELED